MSWTMRIGPSIQQFIVISKQHYLGYKQKFWKFFQDFRENHDEKDQRKEKSHWEYLYDSCLMNHVLWKHRIVGFRRSFDWFSDINHTSKSEFTKSLRVIVTHSPIQITWNSKLWVQVPNEKDSPNWMVCCCPKWRLCDISYV